MGTIYILRHGNGKRVKIGWTSKADSTKRRSTLQTGAPHDLKIIREIPGTLAGEAWMKARFAPWRRRGEWFLFQPEMLTVRPPDSWKAPKPPKGATISAGAVKLGFDPCTDSQFYAKLDRDGDLIIWGKSMRTGHVWTALPTLRLLPRLLNDWNAQHQLASPFPLRQLG